MTRDLTCIAYVGLSWNNNFGESLVCVYHALETSSAKEDKGDSSESYLNRSRRH